MIFVTWLIDIFMLKCIELMGDGCLNNEHFEELGGILKGKLEEHFKNQQLRQGKSSLQLEMKCLLVPG